MGRSLGLIDSAGRFGASALQEHPSSIACFERRASLLRSKFGAIDAGFVRGRLDLSDNVNLFAQVSKCKLEEPVLNVVIDSFEETIERTNEDPRTKQTLIEFMHCAKESGFDLVVSG